MARAGLRLRRRGRILYTLLLLLGLIGVVPLLWTSYTLVSQSQDLVELDQKNIQLEKARGLKEQVAVFVRSLRAQVVAIARTLEVNSTPDQFGTMVAHIRDNKGLERYVGEGSSFYSLNVVNASCTGAGAGLGLQEPAIKTLLQEGCLRGIQGRAMESHPVLSQALNREPLLVIGVPVHVGENGAQGVVLAVASLASIQKLTVEMGQGGVEVYVVDGRGHLVAHSDHAKLEGELDVSGVDIVKRFLVSGGRATMTMPFQIPTTQGPIKMIGTFTGVPDLEWGVIAQVEQEKAYAPSLKMARHAMFLVAAVTLLAILLGIVFAGEISRPIQELANGARRMAGGDYATRVSVKSENEVGLLGEAFNHMGEEIQKSIDEVRRAAATNKELFMGSIKMLANAIDEKDPYTRGHSERVAFYSMIIAKHMGMSTDEVEKVYLSGIIHDVGKIGIEDKILRKAAALTDDEYEIMKQHPRKGLHILDAVPMLKQMAGAGLMHHENVDGSGYPDGLKGDQIPLLGRIVSVADAFDAMTTDRPYSKAMTPEAGIARLRFLAGKKFDLPCVEAMERAFAGGDLAPGKVKRAAIVARQPPPAPPPGA